MDAFAEYVRFRNAREAFLGKVNVDSSTGCWVWTGARKGPYGAIRVRGVIRTAHRASYALFKGTVGDGVSVLHGNGCTNKLCCNPAHLILEVQEKLLTPFLAARDA